MHPIFIHECYRRRVGIDPGIPANSFGMLADPPRWVELFFREEYFDVGIFQVTCKQERRNTLLAMRGWVLFKWETLTELTKFWRPLLFTLVTILRLPK